MMPAGANDAGLVRHDLGRTDCKRTWHSAADARQDAVLEAHRIRVTRPAQPWPPRIVDAIARINPAAFVVLGYSALGDLYLFDPAGRAGWALFPLRRVFRSLGPVASIDALDAVLATDGGPSSLGQAEPIVRELDRRLGALRPMEVFGLNSRTADPLELDNYGRVELSAFIDASLSG
jgi:hypothetical protein